MTNVQKNDILKLIEDEKSRLGSYRAVAKKCGISEATISQLRSGAYTVDSDNMLDKIASALGYQYNKEGWKIATDVEDFRNIFTVLNDAKKASLFKGISDNAGCGKTTAADAYLNLYKKQGVFKLNCREWSAGIFLTKLANELGISVPKGYVSVSDLIDLVCDAAKRMHSIKPLIILDQANSLKFSALRTLIHIENECHGILGVVILGTENLEHEIKNGVRLNKPGYDEIDSRFKRNYIKVLGVTMADCRKICAINGVTGKTTQDEIFKNSNPVYRNTLSGKSIMVIKDKRRLQQAIINKLLDAEHYE
ncbi:ATP-binding protein [Dysgonomonas sp. 521]|uniref:AAA family ATPase n=1 Tax=Dysgonomonas sp. 521 TaxID=2302932 RepID=UPI0013D41307|nr:AAA family ATPase [Dysgonomonas sp. 521]NDV97621.1 ATP-binding protein [Dysgonomonas sp. 521]